MRCLPLIRSGAKTAFREARTARIYLVDLSQRLGAIIGRLLLVLRSPGGAGRLTRGLPIRRTNRWNHSSGTGSCFGQVPALLDPDFWDAGAWDCCEWPCRLEVGGKDTETVGPNR